MKKTVDIFIQKRLDRIKTKTGANQPTVDNTTIPPPGFKPGGVVPEPPLNKSDSQRIIDHLTGRTPQKGNAVPVADLYPGLPSLSSGLKRVWQFETFDSNIEARDFLNKLNIEPYAIYPTSTGKITVWYFKIVKS